VLGIIFAPFFVVIGLAGASFFAIVFHFFDTTRDPHSQGMT